MNTLFIIWLAVAAIALIVETLTAALVTIWFTIGGIVAAIMAYFNCPVWSQLIAFIVVSGLLFLLLFKPLSNWLKNRTTDKDIEIENRLKGSIGIVVEDINLNKQTGRVKINDVDWKASSLHGDIIEKGSTIIVELNRGNTLVVKKKKV